MHPAKNRCMCSCCHHGFLRFQIGRGLELVHTTSRDGFVKEGSRVLILVGGERNQADRTGPEPFSGLSNEILN